MGEGGVAGYGFRGIGVLYDALNRVLWLPGGSDRLRRNLADSLSLGAVDTVLELGCGTGSVTRHLVASGAAVTAIDGAETMLRRARRRAPAASFESRLLTEDLPPGPFSVIVLSFVLHELDSQQRVDILRACAQRLRPGGRIGILEWSTPASPLRARSR